MTRSLSHINHYANYVCVCVREREITGNCRLVVFDCSGIFTRTINIIFITDELFWSHDPLWRPLFKSLFNSLLFNIQLTRLMETVSFFSPVNEFKDGSSSECPCVGLAFSRRVQIRVVVWTGESCGKLKFLKGHWRTLTRSSPFDSDRELTQYTYHVPFVKKYQIITVCINKAHHIMSLQS